MLNPVFDPIVVEVSIEGTHRRLDDIDARRGTWTPDPDELAARMTTH